VGAEGDSSVSYSAMGMVTLSAISVDGVGMPSNGVMSTSVDGNSLFSDNDMLQTLALEIGIYVHI
jgi:hypothetical protein